MDPILHASGEMRLPQSRQLAARLFWAVDLAGSGLFHGAINLLVGERYAHPQSSFLRRLEILRHRAERLRRWQKLQSQAVFDEYLEIVWDRQLHCHNLFLA
jgi:hypothetical protein